MDIEETLRALTENPGTPLITATQVEKFVVSPITLVIIPPLHG